MLVVVLCHFLSMLVVVLLHSLSMVVDGSFMMMIMLDARIIVVITLSM